MSSGTSTTIQDLEDRVAKLQRAVYYLIWKRTGFGEQCVHCGHSYRVKTLIAGRIGLFLPDRSHNLPNCVDTVGLRGNHACYLCEPHLRYTFLQVEGHQAAKEMR